MVRMSTCREITEGDGIVGGLFQLAAGEHPIGVTIDQNRQQGGWVVCLASASRVLLDQLREVQLLNDFHNKAGKMPFG